jgi:ribosomal protein S18 acetylase RimI-like enzyme
MTDTVSTIDELEEDDNDSQSTSPDLESPNLSSQALADDYVVISSTFNTIDNDTDTDSNCTLYTRSIQPSDRDRVQALHEEWFPVKYQDDFYNELAYNRMAYSQDPLFTRVVIANKQTTTDESDNLAIHKDYTNSNNTLRNRSNAATAFGGNSTNTTTVATTTTTTTLTQSTQEDLIACVVGAFIHGSLVSPDMAKTLINNHRRHPYLFYIMTLGVVKDYRKAGLGTHLIKECMREVQDNPQCGVLYLHVITHNLGAIRLYEQLGFHRVKTIPNYYSIDDRLYDCYLYAKYYHGELYACMYICNAMGQWMYAVE